MVFKELIKNLLAFFSILSIPRGSAKNKCSPVETELFAADRRLLFLSINLIWTCLCISCEQLNNLQKIFSTLLPIRLLEVLWILCTWCKWEVKLISSQTRLLSFTEKTQCKQMVLKIIYCWTFFQNYFYLLTTGSHWIDFFFYPAS